MDEWHSAKELSESTQKYIEQNVIKNDYSQTAFLGVMLMGMAGIYIVTALVKQIFSLKLFLISGIMCIIGHLFWDRAMEYNRNLRNYAYQWKYGTVTGKRKELHGRGTAYFLISVDSAECFAMNYKEYKKAQTGQRAILIYFPEALSERQKYYAMLSDFDVLPEQE